MNTQKFSLLKNKIVYSFLFTFFAFTYTNAQKLNLENQMPIPMPAVNYELNKEANQTLGLYNSAIANGGRYGSSKSGGFTDVTDRFSRKGGALKFSNVSRVRISGNDIKKYLNTKNGFTISFWTKIDNAQTSKKYQIFSAVNKEGFPIFGLNTLVKKDPITQRNKALLGLDTYTNSDSKKIIPWNMWFWSPIGVGGDSNLTINNWGWHHVVLAFDQNKVRVYTGLKNKPMNGRSSYIKLQNISDLEKFYLGDITGQSISSIPNLDDFKIFDRPLTDGEIKKFHFNESNVIPPNQTYMIINKKSNMAIAVPYGSMQNGQLIQYRQLHNTFNQHWRFIHYSGKKGAIIFNYNSLLVMAGSSKNDAVQYPFHKDYNDQYWSILFHSFDSKTGKAYYKIRNNFRNRDLAVAYGSTKEGAKIITYQFLNSDDQLWRLEPHSFSTNLQTPVYRKDEFYYIRTANVGSGKLMTKNKNKVTSGVHQVAPDNSDKMWQIIDPQDGLPGIYIKELKTEMYLQSNGANKGAELTTASKSNQFDYLQRWFIDFTGYSESNPSFGREHLKRPNFRIVNVETGYVIDAQNNSSQNYIAYKWGKGSNQNWQFSWSGDVPSFDDPTAVYNIQSAKAYREGTDWRYVNLYWGNVQGTYGYSFKLVYPGEISPEAFRIKPSSQKGYFNLNDISYSKNQYDGYVFWNGTSEDSKSFDLMWMGTNYVGKHMYKIRPKDTYEYIVEGRKSGIVRPQPYNPISFWHWGPDSYLSSDHSYAPWFIENTNTHQFYKLKRSIAQEPNKEIESQDSKLEIYPNPSTGKFTATLNLPEKGLVKINIILLSSLGTEVLNKEVMGAKGANTWELSSYLNAPLTKGIYSIVMSQGNNKWNKKLIIK